MSKRDRKRKAIFKTVILLTQEYYELLSTGPLLHALAHHETGKFANTNIKKYTSKTKDKNNGNIRILVHTKKKMKTGKKSKKAKKRNKIVQSFND